MISDKEHAAQTGATPARFDIVCECGKNRRFRFEEDWFDVMPCENCGAQGCSNKPGPWTMTPKPTPEEFKDKMAELAEDWDRESAHGEMDDLMCEVLKKLGYHEGVDIFEECEKWYA